MYAKFPRNLLRHLNSFEVIRLPRYLNFFQDMYLTFLNISSRMTFPFFDLTSCFSPQFFYPPLLIYRSSILILIPLLVKNIPLQNIRVYYGNRSSMRMSFSAKQYWRHNVTYYLLFYFPTSCWISIAKSINN